MANVRRRHSGNISPLPFRRSESSLARLFPTMSAIISKEDRNQVQRVKAKRKLLRPNQTVSIDESPMMIIPKAKIRNDFNQLSRRSTNIISADHTAGLHLSTIPGASLGMRPVSKASLRFHHHSSRSDIDSGFGSMKRSVTFDEISVGRVDDIDVMSDIDDENTKIHDNYEPYPEGRYKEMPDYVDTYSDNSYIVPKVPKLKKNKSVTSFLNADTDENHEANCPICSGLNGDKERIQKCFGGVDQFFKWFWSRWGNRTEVNNLQRKSQSFQGYRPRFCNIVRSVQLHNRDGRDGTPCTGDSGFDEFDYITKDGRLINRWRRESSTSYEEELSEILDRPSIPEHPDVKQDDLSKGAGTGLDGKPGTPTSVNEDLDRMDLSHMNKNENDNDIDLVPPVVFVERLQDDDGSQNKDTSKLKVPPEGEDNKPEEQDNQRADSPAQPPPSPEPTVSIKQPVKPPSPPPPKKRTCITKKTLDRKPINKNKKKEEMEKPPEELPVTIPSPTPPPVVEEKKEPEIKVDLPEPSLPEIKEPEHKNRKEKKKPEKFAITKPDRPKVDDDTLFTDDLTAHLKKFDLMVQETMTAPEETPRKHTNKPSKMGRLALSQQSSRFTLPMDMKELETMSPKEYIVNYCKITKRRQHLYDNVYRQTVGNVSKPLPYKELEKGLKNVLVDTLSHEHFKYICGLLEIKEGEDINCELFSKMAALAERLLYPQYVTKETEDHKEYQKELIEVADFSALEWKFHGVNVRPDIQKLLKTLC